MNIDVALSPGPDAPFEIRSAELSDPGPGEVLVRLVAVGVCHTDLTVKALIPAEAGGLVLGHEGAGVVERVGADVHGIAEGDRVMLSYAACRDCDECRGGRPTYCTSFAGLNGPKPGTHVSIGDEPVLADFFGQSSFATHTVVAARDAVVVDRDVDLTISAPFGCGVQTGAGAVLNVLQPGPDSALVVYGAGGVGLAAVMAAAAVGVRTIVAVDLAPNRLEIATRVGATHVVDGAADDASRQLHEITGGGASHALDTTGAPRVIAQALRDLRARGELVVVGLGAPAVEIDVQDLLNNGKTLRGCIEGDADPQEFVPRLIELHRAGRFPVEELIVHYPFAGIGEAVDDARSGHTIKPVLVFDGAAS